MASIAGGGGGSSSNSSTKPWGPQQKYLEDIYRRAQSAASTPRSFYEDSTYVPFSQETEDSLQQTAARARAGPSQSALDYQQNVLSGQYLHPSSNPYLGELYSAQARPLVRTFQTALTPGASLTGYGRGGSGAEANRMNRTQDVLAQNLSEMASRIYGGNYAAERGIQEQAAQRAPAYSELAYADQRALGGVGAQREELAGRRLQDLISRFQFKQDEPWDRTADYSNLIGAPVMVSKSKSRAFNFNASAGYMGGG